MLVFVHIAVFHLHFDIFLPFISQLPVQRYDLDISERFSFRDQQLDT